MQSQNQNIPAALPFVEYGKALGMDGFASDFKLWLSASNTDYGNLLRNVYSKSFASNSLIYNLPFQTEEPNFGKTTICLTSSNHTDTSKSFYFVQMEKRVEREMAIRNNKIPHPNSSNRSYNQVRFTRIDTDFIRLAYLKNIAPYTSLLQERDGQLKLKDYLRGDNYPKIEKGLIDYSLLKICSNERLLEGLTNLLYKYFSWESPQKKRITLHLVFPGLSIEEKLELLQSAQMYLLPATGIITFALDYASEALYRFYFCDQEPPEIMKSSSSIIVYGKDLFSINNNDYYQIVKNIPREMLFDQTLEKCLIKSIQIKEAIQIINCFHNKNQSALIEYSGLILEHIDIFVEEFVEFVNQTNDKQILLSFLNEINSIKNKNLFLTLRKFLLDRITQIGNYNIITCHSEFNKNAFQLTGNIKLFPEEYRNLFTKSINNSQPGSIASLNAEDRVSIYSDLIQANDHSDIPYQNGISSLTDIFSHPENEVFIAIQHSIEKNQWNSFIENRLGKIIFSQPDIWTYEKIEELNKITHNRFVSIFIERIKFYLANPKQIDKIKQNPVEQQNEYMLGLLKRFSSSSGSILRDLQDYEHELRNICIDICLSGKGINSTFIKFWIRELAIYSQEAFRVDIHKIITEIEKGRKTFSYVSDEKYLAFILFGPALFPNLTIKTASENLGVNNQIQQIIRVWIKQKLLIPYSDIENLIDQLPDSNELLAEIILNYANDTGIEYLSKLDSKIAEKWLEKTRNSDLRNKYLLKGKDQLFITILNIKNPSDKLVLRIIQEYSFELLDSFSWEMMVSKAKIFINGKYKSQSKCTEIKTYIALIEHLECEPGKEKLYLYGLNQLFERYFYKASAKLEKKELRLFILYALMEKFGPDTNKYSSQVLENHLGYLVHNISDLADEEVWALQRFCEVKNIHGKVYEIFTTEGWKYRNSFSFFPEIIKTTNITVNNSSE